MSQTQGEARPFMLAGLISRFAREALTGTLCVHDSAGDSTAYFRDGFPAGARVAGRFKPLGIFLMEQGLIDIRALDQSLKKMSETKRPQGELLVELEAITKEQLEQGLQEQQGANVEAFLTLCSGEWVFDAEAPPPAWTQGVKLTAEEVVLAACRAPEGLELVREALAKLGSGRLKLLEDVEQTAARFGLTGSAGEALSLLGGTLEVDEIALSSGLELSELLALIAALGIFGMLEVSAGGSAFSELLPPAAGSEAQPASPDLAEPAPVAAGAPKPGPPRSSRATDKSRRSKLLRQAFQNIPGAQALAGKKMGVRDRSGASTVPSGRAKGKVSSSVDEQTRARTKEKLAKHRLGEEGRNLVKETAQWIRTVKVQDYYKRLGLNSGSSAAEIKAAYLTLVKRFHPDHGKALGVDAETLKGLKLIFESVQEAYDTLRDPKERKRYDILLADGEASGGEDHKRLIAAAKLQYRRGMVQFKKKDFTAAVPLLAQAYRADPKNGLWAVAYAWARYSVGPAAEVAKECERIFKRAAGGEVGAAKAYYYLGLIARSNEEFDHAERYLSKAIRIEPSLIEAATELRLVKRRMERVSGTAVSRIMKKLLGG